MLDRGTLERPPIPPDFDAWNRAIRPTSMRGCIGNDMLRGGGGGVVVDGG